jgi:hypothetical protein
MQSELNPEICQHREILKCVFRSVGLNECTVGRPPPLDFHSGGRVPIPLPRSCDRLRMAGKAERSRVGARRR